MVLALVMSWGRVGRKDHPAMVEVYWRLKGGRFECKIMMSRNGLFWWMHCGVEGKVKKRLIVRDACWLESKKRLVIDNWCWWGGQEKALSFQLS
jgi:hypothetical protein